MTSIISNTAASSAQTQTKSEKDFDSLVGTREDFLTILLAQLKHQDPLDPMEGTEFIDSITRLSSVEQDINQNTNLEKIASLLEGQNSQFGSPVSYLDRQIEFKSQAIYMEDGLGEFSYNLEESPEEIFVIIRNQDGNTVYTTNGTNKIGENKFTWDGKNNNGTLQDDGIYTVEVSYVNNKGEGVQLPTTTKGIVDGANFEGDETVLLVNGIRAVLENVISIKSLEEEAPVSDS